MFPEFYERGYGYKPIVYYEQGRCYDKEGKVVWSDVDDAGALLDKLKAFPTICFMSSLTDPDNISILIRSANFPGVDVYCDPLGRPLVARVRCKQSTSWIVPLSAWDLPADIVSLDVLDGIYHHIGLGTAPTPSSLGRKVMRYIYHTHHLKRRYTMPLACEIFLNKHGFGGISITRSIGITVPLVSELDVASNYLTEFIEEEFPDGTPVWFVEGDDHVGLDTWFARVQVTIPKRLALGIFPVRRKDRSVYYPVTRGTYDTYVWKETYEAILESGCQAEVFEGWGWHIMTRDNEAWATWLYEKKMTAPNKFVEKGVKKVAVAGIGSHGRSRDGYILSTDANATKEKMEKAIPVLIGRTPLDLWVIPDFDVRGGNMVHWQRYCVAAANLNVRVFALPFAEQGKLLLVDTDAVFVKGESLGRRFIEKHSLEAIGCKPGTWLWKLHHNFRVVRNRMWLSDEEPNRYGSLLERLMIA